MANSGSKVVTLMAGRSTQRAAPDLLDLGYSFKQVLEPDFLQCLATARLMNHGLPLNMRSINRNGASLGTAYLAGEDPVAFYASSGLCYVLAN